MFQLSGGFDVPDLGTRKVRPQLKASPDLAQDLGSAFGVKDGPETLNSKPFWFTVLYALA